MCRGLRHDAARLQLSSSRPVSEVGTAMGEMEHIQAGMSIYRADGQEIGTVREHWGATLYVNNESIPPIPVEMVDLVLDHGVYLKGNYTDLASTADAFDEHVIRVAARGAEALAAQEATFAARRAE